MSVQGQGALLQHSGTDGHKNKARVRFGRSTQQRLPFLNLDQGSRQTEDSLAEIEDDPPPIDARPGSSQTQLSQFTVTGCRDPAKIREKHTTKVE